MLGAVAALLLAGGLGAAASAATCSVNAGGHVVLASDAVDPDVFVWDSRDHLVEYAAGHWATSHEILEHTALAKPGTKAVVITCYAAFAHPHYSGPQDAIGVHIMTGPLRGKYGWVLSSDLHIEDKAFLSHQTGR